MHEAADEMGEGWKQSFHWCRYVYKQRIIGGGVSLYLASPNGSLHAARGQALLDAAGVVVDEGVLVGGEAKSFLSRAANGRIWVREPRVRTVF